MKLFRYSFLIVLLATFVCCKNNEEKFIREWESKKTLIPHTAHLKIKTDHTFEYRDTGCQWRCNAYGNWEVVNDTLILNSIPSKKCQNLSGFGNNMENPTKKGFIRKTTIKNCNPEERDGEYINFINDKFYIKNDTLEYVTNIKFLFNDRIAFFAKK